MATSALIATGFFRARAPAAIAATGAQYAEMWAQDAAAMSGCATASRRLRPCGAPFFPAAADRNPRPRLTAQAAAVGRPPTHCRC
ncbi:PPE domain-containing protein [Mycobacterium tuberculosis]